MIRILGLGRVWSAAVFSLPCPASRLSAESSGEATRSSLGRKQLAERHLSRKLPGMLDWATFPTVLPNSGLVGHHPFQAEIDHFVECILTGVESHASLHDAVNTHLACFAISESSRAGGRPVAVPPTPN